MQPGIILPEDQVEVQTLDQMSQFQKKSANEAVSYIGGYMTKKLCNKVEGLISETTTSSWIKLKNRGSLFFPSKELVESIHHYEEVFVRLHGENICRQPDPMGRTTEAILKIDKTWPKLVVDLFVKIRFFQRVKVLNSQLKEKHKTNCVRNLKQKAQFIFWINLAKYNAFSVLFSSVS